MTKIKKQIIVIPGIMGSRLRQGLLRIWPSYVGKLRYKTFIGEKLKYKENDKTVATGPLLVYQKLIDNLGQCPDTDVDVFSYDWRKNNLEQLALLEDIIRTEVDEIYIVAHSMGGIIAKLFLNYNKGSEKIKNVKKLITLGTPWHGSPDAYKMIFYGVENPLLLLMSKDNSKDIVATFPSVYQLLPDEIYMSRCLSENKPIFLEEDGNGLSWHDVYNYKYMPIIDNQGLKENEIFNNYYNLINDSVEIEHHEIIGYGLATLYSIIKNTPNEAMCEFNTGDTTVPICSANSNAPYQYFIKEKHQKLPNNKAVLTLINSIINNEEVVYNSEIGCNYEKASKYKFTGRIFKVACPVIVSLIDDEGKTIYGNMDLDENPNISLEDDSEYNVVQIDNILYLILEDNNEICNKDLVDNSNKINNLNKLFIEAYDEGPVSISIEEFNEGKVKKIAAFNSFNINSDISVELSVDLDIDNSSIVINEIGSITRTQKAITKIVEVTNAKIILPETRFEFSGNKVIHAEDRTIIFTAEKLNLEIKDIVAGTNPVIDTRYILNDKTSCILSKNKIIEFDQLDSGINILKIYSIDLMGNAEKENEIKIFFMPDEKPNVEIDFHSLYYTINVQDKYKEILQTYDLEPEEPKIKLQDKNNEYVINMNENNNVEYTNIINNISIEYTNVYGSNYDCIVPIYENEIIAVLQGENNPDILFNLLDKMGVRQPYDAKSLFKYQAKRAVTTINAENIYNSKSIYIAKNNFSINIYKEFRDIVSFQSLMEDIKLYEESSYRFDFKVIDTVTAKEIKNLNLHAYIQIILDKSNQSVYDIDIQYNETTSNYVGLIDIPKLRFVLMNTTYSEERANGLKNASLVIEQVSQINTKIRVHPITIR